VSVGEHTTAAQLWGIDLVREDRTTRFRKKVSQGRYIGKAGAAEVLLGKGLAKVLEAEVGQDLVIVSQAADGSIANDRYAIVGVVDSGSELDDQRTLYLSLQAAQELFVLEGRVHEIAIVLDDIRTVRRKAAQIAGRLANPDLDVKPWQEVAASFYTAMQADKRGSYVMLGIIMLIVAVGVLNTVLMSVLERTREYGVLKALGTRPAGIVGQVLVEVLLMALISVAVGTVLAAGLNYWLSIDGISLSEPLTYGGVVFDRMYTEVNRPSLLIPPAVVIMSAVLVGLFPALKAARLDPARAMHTH
jgi:ABC-type lipoprotein release transport system permease subunit